MAENRGPQVSGVSGLFLAITWIAMALRIYCRLVIVKCFGTDDYLAFIAQIFFTFFCAFAITGVQYGTGQHALDIKPQTNIPIGLKWWWACEPVYVLANLAIKMSICVFLLRIAINKMQRLILWVVMGVSGLVCTYFFFLFVFQCWPVAYFWSQYTGMQGSCIDPKIITASTYMYSAVSCWSDWTCCILPAFMVWNLQMNPRTKFSVCLILALSAVASAATIIRIPYVQNLSDVGDFLYATTDVAVWSITETGLAITASAIATLRPLFRTFLSRSRLLGGSTKESSGIWPSSRAGYQRSQDPHHMAGGAGASRRGNNSIGGMGEEEIGLRTDVGKMVGVTTVIDVDSQHHLHHQQSSSSKKNAEVRGKDSSKGVRVADAPHDWNNSQSKLTDDSSEEFASSSAWAHGIRKTMVVSTHRS